MRYVAEHELDTLASIGSSIHWTFFGVSVGALVSFGIVLSTTKVNDPKLYAAYVALTAVSVMGTLCFACLGLRDYSATKDKLQSLKKDLTGTYCPSGKEAPE